MIRHLVLLSLATIVVTACFDTDHIGWPVSLHGLHLDEDTFVDYDLAGAWRPASDTNAPPAIIFSRRQEEYLVAFQIDGSEDWLAGQSLQVGGLTLIDVSMARGQWAPFLFNRSSFVVPVHLILRVDQADDSLSLRLLDQAALERLLRRHPRALRHTDLNGGMIITSTTSELRAFFDRFGGDQTLFEEADGWLVRFSDAERAP